MECAKVWNSLDWFNSSTLSCLDNAPASPRPMRWLSYVLTDQSEARITRPSWESTLADITGIADLTRCWHESTESRDPELVFSHSRDKSSCERRIWEIWESCQEQRSGNMWKTTAQLRFHNGVKVVCNTGLIMTNSSNSLLLTASIFISLQVRYRYRLCVLTLKQIYHRI